MTDDDPGKLPDELPPVHTGQIDDLTLDAMMTDLETCAKVHRVRVKGAATVRAKPGSFNLRDAIHALRIGTVGSVQIHYHFEDQEWLDTLTRDKLGYKVVRFPVPSYT